MIEYSYMSSKGSYDVNEDKIGIVDLPDRKCFILADGLGGHGKGEIASGAAVMIAQNELAKRRVVNQRSIEECFLQIHTQLLEMQQHQRLKNALKTTMVLLVIENDLALWAHVGDSRLYAFHRFFISHQTKDHSVPQMMVNIGEIKSKDIRTSPDRNRLLSALGMSSEYMPKLEVHTPAERVKKGHGFLLCSDGFWEYIHERQMEQCFRRSQNAEMWLKQMTGIVEQNGMRKKMDNYSAIAVKIR